MQDIVDAALQGQETEHFAGSPLAGAAANIPGVQFTTRAPKPQEIVICSKDDQELARSALKHS